MGSRILRRLQLGQEASPGVLVAATTIWGGPAESIEDTREVNVVQQDIGRLSPGLRTYTPMIGAEYEMPETPVTFEQICHIFQAAMGAATATNDGSGRVRPYGLPRTSRINPKTYTLEAGDDEQAYRMGYSFVPKFKITGKLQSPLTVECTWVGQQRLKTSYTPGVEVPTNLKEVMFGSGRLYIDDSSIGSTQKLGTFIGFELEVETGLIARYAADGNLYFSAIRQGVPSAELQLTFEHDATGVSEQDKWEQEALRLVRLEFTGPALSTPGAQYTNKLLRFDMAGKWIDFSKLGDEDGSNVVTGTLHIGDEYVQGTGLFFDALVVNEDNALP